MARRRRWIIRILLGLVGLVVVCVGLALLVANNLEWGPVKRFVQKQARAQGLEIDYDAAGATLGGVKMRGLRLLMPPADAGLAPAMVSIARIDGRWSPFSKRLDELVIRDVDVTLVVDDDGTTSIDRLVAGMPKRPPTPPQPLSALLSALPKGFVASARVEGVTVTLIPRGKGDSIRLEGVEVAAQLGADGRLAVKLGPTELKLARGERGAVAKLAADVEADAGGRARAGLDVTLVRQDLAPDLPHVEHVVALSAAADFVPADRRTRVRVDRLSLLDGAATLVVDADLRDVDGGGVRAVVHAASGTADLQALAKAVPPDLGPLAVEAEPLELTAKELELAPPRGTLAAAGKIGLFRWRDVEVRGVDLDVDARPEGDVLHARAHVPVAGLALPGLSAERVDVTLAATIRGPRSLDVEAGIDVGRLAGPAVAERAHVDLRADGLALAEPALASTGKVTASGRVAAAALPGGPRAADVTFRAGATLGAPARADLEVDAAKLYVPSVAELAGRPAHLAVDATRIDIDAAAPARSRGEAKIAASWGDAKVDGTVAGSVAEVVWDLAAQAERFGPARKIAVASKGKLAAGIEQDTTVSAGSVAAGAGSVRGLTAHVTSSGTLRRHEAKVAATFQGASVGGRDLGAAKLDAIAAVDLDARRADVKLTGDSPPMDVHVAAELDAAHALRWEAQGKIAQLGPLAAFLPEGVGGRRTAVELSGKGTVAGVVRGVRDGVPVLAPHPLATARGRQSLELKLRDVHVRRADGTRADVDALAARAQIDLGEARRAVVDVDVPSATAVASGATVEVDGLTVHVDAALAKGREVKAALGLKARSARQTAFAAYPVRDAELSVTVAGDPQVTLSVGARLTNPGAGTALDVAGKLEQTAEPAEDALFGRHSLTLEGKIEQSLDDLNAAPDQFRARGKVSMPFQVESGDLTLFRVSARAALADVTVELPDRKVRVADVRGEIPVVQEILVAPGGVQRVGSGERGLYPLLRFADHQPFLGTADYLSVGEVRVGERSFGPIAGNIRVDHDVFSVDQLEMSALGGKIGGQCLLELAGKDTALSFRGKVTGIRPSSGDDRLDANAALTLVPYRLGLEGRVEIVRIGRDHLYDLLDVWDPYHADVSANRIRFGLKLGYPKQVRLHFLRGFGSLAVELGGLAGVVRIDEIRGVPVGPALERYLAPVLEEKR
ncbi:MAG TPA: hypothetical protein VKE22_31035 [Haliangiales bacterium]|nr:hypothetical protein [Haliangiales bacterium]